MLIAYAGSLNVAGLLGYELTRLVGFERQHRAVPVDARTTIERPARTPGDFRNTVPVHLK
ncbi:MAG: hypothetical protein QUV35_15275 [Hydrogenophaga sp.]|uniref:hypothetical protein n=1 Tax=Hydrogenophaga sp. TaxID=1904254 RepID=UPI00262D8F12|nr:hypothetical protein [Hydrogenophaga sp.]MDM7943984.1 hypothetical protein [Hydrogenophaga sp.]